MTAPSTAAVVVSNILFNLNILTIAVLTGIAANRAKAATDEYLNSNSPVMVSGHIALLVDGWSDSLPPVLRQLRIAAADQDAPSELRRPVIVLTGRPKPQALALLHAAAAGSAAGLPPLELIVRQGDPRLAADARRVRAECAAHVALLSADTDRAGAARRTGIQAAALRQLRARASRPLALLELPAAGAGAGGWWRRFGRDFTVLEDDEFVGRLLGVLARPAPPPGVTQHSKRAQDEGA